MGAGQPQPCKRAGLSRGIRRPANDIRLGVQACHEPAGAEEEVRMSAYTSLAVRLIFESGHSGGFTTSIHKVRRYEAVNSSSFRSQILPNL